MSTTGSTRAGGAAGAAPPAGGAPSSECFVSVVAPLRDDLDIVEAFVHEVLDLLRRNYANYELVLVDDGSTDGTVERVREMLARERCIRLIRLSRPFGRDIAISAGLDTVIGDFVVVLLPETDPPELIPVIVERCRSGAGVVYGIRERRLREPAYLRIGSRLFYWFFNRLVGVALPRNSTDYRAYSRQAVNAITRIRDHLRYLRTFGTYIGFGTESFVYAPRPRRARVRSRGFGEAVGLAINMTVANSTRPLRFASLLGLVLGLVSALHSGYVLVVRLTDRSVAPGWATQQIYGSLMFSFVFVILAITCEYLGRLLGEVRSRPLYFVLEEQSSTVLLVDEQRRNVVTDTG